MDGTRYVQRLSHSPAKSGYLCFGPALLCCDVRELYWLLAELTLLAIFRAMRGIFPHPTIATTHTPGALVDE